MQYHFDTAQIYITKFVLTGMMLFFPFMEQIDITLRLVAAVAGIILTIVTIRRMQRDIQIRNEELRIKKLARQEAEMKMEEFLIKKYS